MKIVQCPTNRVLPLFLGAYFILFVVLLYRARLCQDAYYYWAWSQYLALSYYDGPPLVAYLLKLYTIIFGEYEFSLYLFSRNHSPQYHNSPLRVEPWYCGEWLQNFYMTHSLKYENTIFSQQATIPTKHDGNTTKIHMAVDTCGFPIKFNLTRSRRSVSEDELSIRRIF